MLLPLSGQVSNLTDRIRNAVGPKKGMRNDVIGRFCKLACSDNFRGVYPVDRLPHKITARPSFIIIVNLGRVDGKKRFFGDTALPPGHFVTVIATPSSVHYIDPFGLPVQSDLMSKFLYYCNRRIRVNRKQIQSKKSNYCGLYCILFACYADGLGNDLKLEFFINKESLKRNDALCSKYLIRMFN